MATQNTYDRVKGEEEHILSLPEGRQLAYAHNGPPASRTVVIFFSGLMSVGTASEVPKPCRDINAHWISPTLPGMGNSSGRDKSEPYHVALARDMTALLSHLYPTSDFDSLYIAGGSYGTVPAQMLYGAPYDLFPAGRKILGCILLAGFSPFKYDTNHSKSLNWQSWFSVGPPSQIVPFHLLQRLFSTAIGSKLKTLDGAKDFLRGFLFDKMDDEEKSRLTEHLERQGRSESDFIDQMARNAVKSCQNWEGFLEVSDVIHSDWGFNPAALDDEHATKPVLVVGSDGDDVGGGNNAWLVANYKSARAKTIPGGHISALYYMDEIWGDLIGSE